MLRHLLSLRVFAAFLVGAGPALAQTFVPAPLPALLRRAGLPDTVRFGYVAVPENRGSDNGRMIQVAVTILPATQSTKRPDPIFFLEGGPGGTASYLPLSPTFSILAQDRDIVFVDQRGCGFSRPFLGANSNDVTVPYPPIKKALARFRSAGIPLECFNTAENAADIEAVRVALGYGAINLLGHSYGSVLAQQMMSDFPANLRSVVLSGVVPLRGWDFVPGNQLVQRDALRALFRDVRRTRRARAAFPNLARHYEEVVARLLEKPVMVPRFGRLVRLDAFSFQMALLGLMQAPNTICVVPLFIQATWEGRYEEIGRFIPDDLSPVKNRSFAFGMYLSVMSRDFFPPGSAAKARAAADALPDSAFKEMTRVTVSRLARAINRWPVRYDPTGLKPPFGSAIPTLLLQGDMDAQTPSRGGTDAARLLGLRHAFVISVPRSGHSTGATQGPAFNAVRQFFAEPHRRPVVSFASLRRPNFYRTRFPVSSRMRTPAVAIPQLPTGW